MSTAAQGGAGVEPSSLLALLLPPKKRRALGIGMALVGAAYGVHAYQQQQRRLRRKAADKR